MTDAEREDESIISRYDLCANVCHEGLVTKAMGTNEVLLPLCPSARVTRWSH